MNGPLFARFVTRAGLPGDASLREVVNAVQAVPYGRPGARTAEGVIGEWKGTCSTKHALLARLLGQQWPELQPRFVHLSKTDLESPAGQLPESLMNDVSRGLRRVLGL